MDSIRRAVEPFPHVFVCACLLPRVPCPGPYPTVIQLFAQYMGSVSTVTTVKWLWFLINVGALAGVLMHLARIFKAGADAKGGEVAQLYGELTIRCFYPQ